ncbi:DUF6057 family protein, partial [Bacteroidota bacterium]
MNDYIDRLIRYSTIGVISILSVCYFWFLIDPSIIHFKQQPLFLFNHYFLAEYISFPGGIAEYLSMFLSQFLYSTILGSLILMFLIFIICFLFYKLLLNYFSKKTSFYIQFVPGLILVHLHSHYAYDFRGDIIFLASIIAAIIYNKLFTISLIKKVSLLLITSFILLLLFGGTSLLLFSIII